MNDLTALSHALLDAARKAGADDADVVARQGTSVSIDIRGGALEQAERAEGFEIGLRVLLGKRQACVSGSDARREGLEMMAERAVAMAREAPEDPWIGLAEPGQLSARRDAEGLEMYDPAGEPDPEALKEAAVRAEAAALAVEGISQVSTASAAYGESDIRMLASNGFEGGYRRSSHSLACVAIAGEGERMERDHDSDGRIFAADMRDAEEIGRRAAERALARQGARAPKTGAYPVLYDERVAASLIGHLIGAVNGQAVARGSSFLRDALGEAVLPDALSLTEDPLRPRGGQSRPFDAEGLAVAPRDIIHQGMLTGFTVDLATARKLGVAPTGNAARGLSAPPSPSTWNLELTPGAQTREELIAEMGTGLLVTSLIGSTINPNTGDYSRGAAGFWIENGEIRHPVHECTIAGNLRDMLRALRPANDARPWASLRVPSLLVEGMTLAGS
ncbi:peptidase PmbA [Pseudooceanicola marinus]|uniref:Peptidase PmbA n=1 Tax=Pseudooceanicola marinus TaxID=396013 RepID=A0A1X7A394_9RHOB|nr:TldD/PmbA family protein [Pseudooceanicola marinus]PJE31147.1 TldD/PmbA family protein [Pseudooceanicola marinus]SLN69342.1 peptidase PmbA [Pseudooceanicola marinus]